MKKVFALILAVMMIAVMAVGAVAQGAETKGTGVQLTVYTNSGSSGRAEWLIERAAQDGFKLAVLE